MILAPPFLRVVEQVDRRVLGAFQFVDAVTRLPVAVAAKVEVRRAELVNAATGIEVSLQAASVQIRQTKSAFHAILRAPFFDPYAASFIDPQNPPETLERRLRLNLAVTNAGAHYLPQQFQFDLPCALDRTASDSVFRPRAVNLFRAPGAPVLGGWSVLRVRVTQLNTGLPLSAVLVRVFRGPRGTNDLPIGQGMSEWRGDLRGEALVAVAGIPRFRPGASSAVFETEQAIHFEATRDTDFGGDVDQLPDLGMMTAGAAPTIISRRSDRADGLPPLPLAVQPPSPLNIRAGRELAIHMTMP
jgi:hypothetical protein